MNNYKLKIGVFLFITLYIFGCNDQFLNRTPLDAVSNPTYWNTENDLKVYNNSLYNLAQNDNDVPIMMGHDNGFDSHAYSIWYQDEFSDNAAPVKSRHEFYQKVRSGKFSVPASPQWFGYKGWNFVRAINVGLAHYNNADISQEIIDKYAGEARLFRGWFYAEKVEKFGKVPWIDKPLNVTDTTKLYGHRTPRDTVMTNVLKDLNFAAESLPDSWGGSPGRLNRWCALAVKARVCLFEGTWRKYHGGSNAEMWLQEAADAAKKIMDDGPYEVFNTGHPKSDYSSYMRKLDLSGNPEVIYWRDYKQGISTNIVQSYFQNLVGGATKSLVDDYLSSDGLPIASSPLYKGDNKIEDVFKNRDPRLRQTVLHPSDSKKLRFWSGGDRSYPRITGMTGGKASSTGYHIIKFYNADDVIGHAYNTGESPAIILRYGEVLLNFAESKAELGELTQQDLDISINLLRDRVAMPHMVLGKIPPAPQYTNEGVSPLIGGIRRERRVELAFEGFRYNDLKRWKQGKLLEKPSASLGMRWNDAAKARYPDATVKAATDPKSNKNYIDVYAGTDYANPVFDESKDYLWPIPTSIMAQNKNIKQNPGW